MFKFFTKQLNKIFYFQGNNLHFFPLNNEYLNNFRNFVLKAKNNTYVNTQRQFP